MTNDDGIDSPALIPLVAALSVVGSVRTVVPDAERSWISKAISRQGDLDVQQVTREGRELHAVSGFPADCVQLGIHSLFPSPPAVVVSGINLGYNFGSAFAAGSGTVGAAAEAALAGVPAVAISAGPNGMYREWLARALRPESRPDWDRLAAVAVDVLASIMDAGFPEDVDVLSINIPEGANLETPRRVTKLGKTRYGALFTEVAADRFEHAYSGPLLRIGEMQRTDIEAADDGAISITPIRLTSGIEPSDELTSRLERP